MPKTWSWSRGRSWTRCGRRTGACGVRPGIVKPSGASGPTPGKAVPSPARNWPKRGESVSDRVLRFPDRTWDELNEPVPALADPFPEADPLPGAYRLHLPSDGLTIWYTVTETPDGQVVIVVQYVKADT